MKNQTIYNKQGTFILDENGIIHITPIKNSKITSEIANEVIKTVHLIANDKPYALLIDNREVSSIDLTAQKLFAKKSNNKNTIAVAFIIKSPLSYIVVNFFIKLNKLSKPTKFFLSTSEAINWLKGNL